MRHEIDHWYEVKYYSLEEYHLDSKFELIWHDLYILEHSISYFIHWSVDLVIDSILSCGYTNSIFLDKEKVMAEVNAQEACESHPEDVDVAVGPRFAVNLINFHIMPVRGA